MGDPKEFTLHCVEDAKLFRDGKAAYVEQGDKLEGVPLDDAIELIGSGRFVTEQHLPKQLKGEGKGEDSNKGKGKSAE